MAFVREEKYECGTYREVDLVTRIVPRRAGEPNQRQRLICPSKQALNEQRSVRYFTMTARGNFKAGDLHLTLTYAPWSEPDTETGKKHIRSYLQTLRRHCRERGLPDIKWLLVRCVKEKGGKPARLHHHLLLSCGLPRDEIEGYWKYGRANTKRISDDWLGDGVARVARYLSFQMAGRKSWTGSQNLIKPDRLPNNDHRLSLHQLDDLATREWREQEVWGNELQRLTTLKEWQKMYPGWQIVGYRTSCREYLSVHLKLIHAKARPLPPLRRAMGIRLGRVIKEAEQCEEKCGCRGFKRIRGIQVSYKQQIFTYATCINYFDVSKSVQKKIDQLCCESDSNQAIAAALRELLITDGDADAIAKKHHVSVSSLYRRRAWFYKQFDVNCPFDYQ